MNAAATATTISHKTNGNLGSKQQGRGERMTDLSKTDLRLIRQTYWANHDYGVPFLPAIRWHKRAKALADRGLLTAHETGAVPLTDWAKYSFSVTQAGIDAYNAAQEKP
jgi:hypothetical protein